MAIQRISSIVHRVRSCGFTGDQYVFNIPSPGGHAGRSRAHIELVRCTNPHHILPCGPHARADVEILPFCCVRNHFIIQLDSQRASQQTMFNISSRLPLRLHRKPILRTPAATRASGVHLMGRAWPLGATKRSACVVSPDLVIAVVASSSTPLRARRSGGHQNICSRALPNSSDSKLVSAFLPRVHIASYVAGGRVGAGGAL